MATTVKFLKSHGRHKQGEIASLIDDAANYFIRCKVAELVTEEQNPKRAPKKKAAPKNEK